MARAAVSVRAPSRALTALCLVSALALSGCTEPQPSASPEPSLVALPHALGGCRFTRDACGVKPDQTVRLWVPNSVSKVRIENAAIEGTTVRADGTTYQLKPVGIPTIMRVSGVLQARSAHLSISVTPARSPRFTRARERMAAGELDAAQAALKAELAGAEPDAEALGLMGRIALRRGESKQAAQWLKAASDAHLAAGALSEADDDLSAAVFVWTSLLGDLDAAYAGLQTPIDFPEAQAMRLHLSGRILAERGQLQQALVESKRAFDLANRVGGDSLRATVAASLAELHEVFGRFKPAVQLLAEAAATSDGRPCQAQALRSGLGWLRLRQGVARGTSLEPALADLKAAAQMPCQQAVVRGAVHLNLAFGALAIADKTLARRALTEIGATNLGADLTPWTLDAKAALHLLDGEPAQALAAYRALGQAAAEEETALQWRALVGQAEAFKALGKTQARIRALRAAEAVLDSKVAAIPAQVGREAFVADRGVSARRLVQALIRAGQPAEALAAARRSRARALTTTLRLQSEGTPAQRKALLAYRAARKALAADRAADLTRSAQGAAQAKHARIAQEEAAADLLDAALDGRQTSPLPDRPADALSVLMHPVSKGWAVIVWQGSAVKAAVLPRIPGEAAEALAARLIQPALAWTPAATRVEVFPMGPLRAVDFHALTVNGQPWGAQVAISYPLDMATRAPSARQGAVVIADPRLDLPGAVTEGRAVVAALKDQNSRLLVGDAATFEAFTQVSTTARILHYAGHGVFSEAALQSALPLAESTALTAADILALPGVPDLVVLSGCETSTAGGELVDAVGLAQAFIAAGARAVVATTRRVKDTEALAFSTALYAAPTIKTDIVQAVRLAQADLRKALPNADWSVFRVLVR